MKGKYVIGVIEVLIGLYALFSTLVVNSPFIVRDDSLPIWNAIRKIASIVSLIGLGLIVNGLYIIFKKDK